MINLKRLKCKVTLNRKVVCSKNCLCNYVKNCVMFKFSLVSKFKGTNFNHYVQERRKDGHVLVKNGIYSLVRHPSYFGWFYWSVGTQVLLANPICLFLYAYASWKFFNTRIAYEEFHLIKFFGREYTTYQKQVSTGIPFISGYTIEGDDNLD